MHGSSTYRLPPKEEEGYCLHAYILQCETKSTPPPCQEASDFLREATTSPSSPEFTYLNRTYEIVIISYMNKEFLELDSIGKIRAN